MQHIFYSNIKCFDTQVRMKTILCSTKISSSFTSLSTRENKDLQESVRGLGTCNDSNYVLVLGASFQGNGQAFQVHVIYPRFDVHYFQ